MVANTRRIDASFVHSLIASLFVVWITLLHADCNAQCETCVPDSSCISTDGFPTMCPFYPPDATVNEYYSQNITFYLPTQVNDPASGVNATLLQVTISSVSGLPYGLQFSFNDNDNVFLPSSGENFGCATICGTPIIPGTYQVIISADVLLNALGFETALQQSFSTSITVLAAEGQTGSFTFDQNAGCGSVDVNFNASFIAPPPALTTYQWNFGNGTSASSGGPIAITYANEGTYTASLTTTIANFSLEQVSVSNLNDNWSGDIDDAFGNADPYFQLINGSGAAIFTSSTNDNTTNTSWSVSPITLTEPPYSLQFFDDDDFSPDDALGSFSLELTQGEHFFDVGNGTVGTYSIGLAITTEITDSTIITVFPFPNDTLTLNGDVAFLVEESPATVFWLQNDLPTTLSGNSVQLTESGIYRAELTNEFGCFTTTNEIVYCAPIQIEYNTAIGELSVPDSFDSYQWYFNGLPIDGATNSYWAPLAPGNYAIEVTTNFGCAIESDVYIIENSIANVASDAISVYPNPAKENIAVKTTSPGEWQITDAAGRVMLLGKSACSSFDVDVHSLESGIYLLTASSSVIRFIKQ
jgi:PKD domain/Secretion system C-terminal sorting domain